MAGRKEKGNMLKEMLKFRASLNKIIPISIVYKLVKTIHLKDHIRMENGRKEI